MIISSNTLETLTTGYSTTTTINDDNDANSLTAALATSSTTTATLDTHTINVQIAQNYIDSLSTEQVAELSEQLDQKELEFDNVKVLINDQNKVYKKV